MDAKSELSSRIPASSDLADVSAAVVHDWFTSYVGGERVVEQILHLFPRADIFASIDTLPAHERAFLCGRPVSTSPAQHWPLVRKHYRALLPLMMFAIEQLDVSGHELVLSSSSAIGKGVITGPDQLHISYLHSPMRYAWDLQHEYLRDAGMERGFRGLIARRILHDARIWDLRTANGVDFFVANSQFIANRIWKVYRRKAHVIYPPVDVENFQLCEAKENFYLSVARMVPYKKIPVIAEAFKSLPDKRLVVIGDGTEMSKVKAVAGRNVEVLGYQPTSVVRDYMQRAKAMVFAAEEDFGIGPVEAQACGTPVIAFGRGGALETIRGPDADEPSGVFFDDQGVPAIVAAIQKFERTQETMQPRACRQSALRFSIELFRQRYTSFVQECLDQFRAGAHRV